MDSSPLTSSHSADADVASVLEARLRDEAGPGLVSVYLFGSHVTRAIRRGREEIDMTACGVPDVETVQSPMGVGAVFGSMCCAAAAVVAGGLVAAAAGAPGA
jgi:hypothetical protein